MFLKLSWYLCIYLLCCSKASLESDAFNKSIRDRDGSSLASERVVCRSVGSSVGRTSWAPIVSEFSSSASCQEISRVWSHCFFMIKSCQVTCPRVVFRRKLQKSLLWTLEDPQHVSTRESGLDSFIGILEGISLHVRSLFCRYQKYSCECRSS